MTPFLLPLLLGYHNVSSCASHMLLSSHGDVPPHLTTKGRASSALWAGNEQKRALPLVDSLEYFHLSNGS